MLNFLGRGSGFYPQEGNTSAYLIEDSTMFLIDCGETVFRTIIENNLLYGIKNVNVIITHTHSDHIGSLGSLILYCQYALQIPLNILVDENVKHSDNIMKFLLAMGIDETAFKFVNAKDIDNKFRSFNSIRYVSAKHCEQLNCCSVIFGTNKGLVYYSGDSNNATYIKHIIESGKPIDSMYVDVTNIDYLKSTHLDLKVLAETVPVELRDKVYCMHFSGNECIIEAEKLGFKVVDVIGKEISPTK